jgi:hypothetical protein
MYDRAAEFLEELPNSDAIAAAGKQVSELAKRLGHVRETFLVVDDRRQFSNDSRRTCADMR